MVPITTEGPRPFQRYPWHSDRFSSFGDHREQTYIKNLNRFIYIDKPKLAQRLENLNEVRFSCLFYIMDDIMPFIRSSAKLKKIVVHRGISDGTVIDPVAMNREREKLLTKNLYVSKVTIYIPEAEYLATKWKTTETDLKLIKIRRFESWDQSNLPI